MINIEDITNKIICADCMDILKQLPDKCVDLVLTDPPYGIGMARTQNCISHFDKNGKNIKGFRKREIHKKKEWDNERPSKDYFEQMIRVSKNQIIFGGNYFADYLTPSRGWIFWDKKEHPTQGKNFADGELAYTSFDKNLKKYIYGWIGLDYVNNSKEDKKEHPTQKPLKLFEMILCDYSKENDLILDCFSGSGTTAIACHRLNRRFICIEKDREYWEASCKRLEDEQRQYKLF